MRIYVSRGVHRRVRTWEQTPEQLQQQPLVSGFSQIVDEMSQSHLSGLQLSKQNLWGWRKSEGHWGSPTRTRTTRSRVIINQPGLALNLTTWPRTRTSRLTFTHSPLQINQNLKRRKAVNKVQTDTVAFIKLSRNITAVTTFPSWALTAKSSSSSLSCRERNFSRETA